MLTHSIGIVVEELLNHELASLHERLSIFEDKYERFSIFVDKYETDMTLFEDPEQIGAALSAVHDNDGHGMPEESFEHIVSVDANNASEPLPSDEALQKQSDVIVTVRYDGLTHTGSNIASGTEDGDVKAANNAEFDYLALHDGAMTNQSECFVIDDFPSIFLSFEKLIGCICMIWVCAKC